MTRQEAREQGRSLGLQLGVILAEETLKTAGPLPPEVAAARTAITYETIAGAAARMSTSRKRDEFRVSAEQGVVAALDTAQVTVAAMGAPN